MNQITTRYVTENGACYEQYVITDAEAKTELVITPERGGMITGFSLNGEEYIWTRHPNFPSAIAPASACRCCSPTAACRITACTSLTARHTPWRTTALPTCAHRMWRASARTA